MAYMAPVRGPVGPSSVPTPGLSCLGPAQGAASTDDQTDSRRRAELRAEASSSQITFYILVSSYNKVPYQARPSKNKLSNQWKMALHEDLECDSSFYPPLQSPQEALRMVGDLLRNSTKGRPPALEQIGQASKLGGLVCCRI